MQSVCEDKRLEFHQFDIDEMQESHAEDICRLRRQIESVEAQYASSKRMQEVQETSIGATTKMLDACFEQLAAAEAKADEFEKQAKSATDEKEWFQTMVNTMETKHAGILVALHKEKQQTIARAKQ